MRPHYALERGVGGGRQVVLNRVKKTEEATIGSKRAEHGQESTSILMRNMLILMSRALKTGQTSGQGAYSGSYRIHRCWMFLAYAWCCELSVLGCAASFRCRDLASLCLLSSSNSGVKNILSPQ